jgi:hypothetical protein
VIDGRLKGVLGLVLLLSLILIALGFSKPPSTLGRFHSWYSNPREPPDVEWLRTYGGGGGDVGWSVHQTRDGGYIIVGSTATFGAGSYDVWLIKTDPLGAVEWNRTFGGEEWDVGWSVEETADGGYVIAGATMSYGLGHYDLWLIKTDEEGKPLWNLTYGGADWDVGYCVRQTMDGGYIVAGCTRSLGSGDWDALLLRVNAEGMVVWNRTYGGLYEDGGWFVQEDEEGGFILAGYRTVVRGELADAWLIRTDKEGEMLWSLVYGGEDDDWLFSVQRIREGYILAGSTGSFGAGDYDYWLMKVDEEGRMLWNKTYGGSGREIAWLVESTRDGGYILVGGTTSFGSGDWDVWLLKTDRDGNPQWNATYGGEGRDRGWGLQPTRDGGYILVGYTTLKGERHWDLLLIKLTPKGMRLTTRGLLYISVIALSAASITLLFLVRRRRIIKVP